VIRAAQATAADAAEAGSVVARVQGWWLKGAEGDQAWRSLSATEKVLYEAGKNTLTGDDYAKVAGIADDVEKGKVVLQSGKLLSPTGWLEAGKMTWAEGPTAGVRWLLSEGAGVVGAGTQAAHGAEALPVEQR
jgi:hypothetical protein